MLVLGRVTSLDVTQWGIRLHDPLLSEVLEGHQITGLAQSIQPSPTERQGAKVFVDDVEELLAALKTEGNVTHVKVLHVVTALHVVVDEAENKINILHSSLSHGFVSS